MKIHLILSLIPFLGLAQVPDYTIQPFAGKDPFGNNGPAIAAYLYPSIIRSDNAGNFFILDQRNAQLRKIAANNTITQIAGVGGATNFVAGRTMKPSQLSLNGASALLVESTTSLLIASGDCQILRLDLAKDAVTLVAGGPHCTGSLPVVSGMAADPSGVIYMAAPRQHTILKLDPSSGQIQKLAGTEGTPGFADGSPGLFNSPADVAADSSNNLYVADTNNCRIRKINTSSGSIQTAIGTGACGFNDNGRPGPQTMINLPTQVAVDSGNALFFTESQDARVRKYDFESTNVGPVADGASLDPTARLFIPLGLAVYTGNLYIADQGNNRIRRINLTNSAAITFAGRPPFAGDGGPAAQAVFQYPWGVYRKPDGSGFLIADSLNYRIRAIDSNGIITTVGGTGGFGNTGDGGPATQATIAFVSGVVADSQGNIYFNELGSDGRIRVIRPDGTTATLAKPGPSGFLGLALDPTERYLYTSAISARVYQIDTVTGASKVIAGASAADLLPGPDGIAVDANGTIYVADSGNNMIRRIRGGAIDTLANLSGLLAQEWPGAFASLHQLAFDPKGNLIVSALPGILIHVDIATGDAVRIAGSQPGGFAGDGGAALAAFMGNPQQIAVDPNGRIYFSDYTNHRIRMLVPSAAVVASQSGDGQAGDPEASLDLPLTVLVTSVPDVPLNDVEVQFVVTDGAATISADTVRTGLDGTASVTVTLGDTPGPVTVTATVGQLPEVQFGLTILDPAATIPQRSKHGPSKK